MAELTTITGDMKQLAKDNSCHLSVEVVNICFLFANSEHP
ncbi:hypothetical protein PARC_p0032 (plasmid) [Pseudoalteromonas arctica A 37-1-2]|uniref:Uncharacterized protein n=1 Tax=Pseudoalteromonas arctica A 37-1-2 TaxID=1117313 RepID=A0A290SBY5_9GAMM|nr:hypothetical protein PARC_p0032 [Pseudoalteromonas arctica A 37-1-2]